ncbi:hypothetical protein ACVIW3_004767 [Bradyrhizobium diazoefficiens]
MSKCNGVAGIGFDSKLGPLNLKFRNSQFLRFVGKSA